MRNGSIPSVSSRHPFKCSHKPVERVLKGIESLSFSLYSLPSTICGGACQIDMSIQFTTTIDQTSERVNPAMSNLSTSPPSGS